MSVTVADLLNLPSLKPARVVAGAGGLARTVAYVSVLEYADPQILEDDLFPDDTYSGSEIVITGFMNNPGDERLQCAVVRRLAEAGEVGLILYYVGIYMPSVPEEMKRIAEEKDFVLILMPEGRMDFRYGEAICEIMERIVRDRMANPAFVSELLEQVSRLPRHQRTVDTMLKMLSERMMASFLLTDGSLGGFKRSHLAPQPGKDSAGLPGDRKAPRAGAGSLGARKRFRLPALPRLHQAGPEPPHGAVYLPRGGAAVPGRGGAGRGRGSSGGGDLEHPARRGGRAGAGVRHSPG